MIPVTHRREVALGARTLSIETGKLAKQADGAVIVRAGDTMVLVTACHAHTARTGIDFLPLTVDYREYTYASGRIPGGFFKREGKPAEKEVLDITNTGYHDQNSHPSSLHETF
jgi:polyribonucleotide nucleotidyltransferase